MDIRSIGTRLRRKHRSLVAATRAQSSAVSQLVVVGATLFIGIVVLSQIGDAMPDTGMFNSSFDSAVSIMGSAISLAAILPLVIIAGALLFYVRNFGGGGGRR